MAIGLSGSSMAALDKDARVRELANAVGDDLAGRVAIVTGGSRGSVKRSFASWVLRALLSGTPISSHRKSRWAITSTRTCLIRTRSMNLFVTQRESMAWLSCW